jgi:hypothetical protein
MYSEVHIAEVPTGTRQKLSFLILGNLGSSPKREPRIFGKLEAEDPHAEREPKQLTLAEHKPLFALERFNRIKFERPKKVETTQQEGFVCVGGFSNPLF